MKVRRSEPPTPTQQNPNPGLTPSEPSSRPLTLEEQTRPHFDRKTTILVLSI